METITNHFNEFREVARNLRNTHYVPVDSDKWDRIDDFYDISVMLFQHLVCAPLGIEYDKSDWFCEPIPFFKLKSLGARLPIMINRLPNVEHGNWDHEISMVSPDYLELTFMSYFDWNEQAMIDYQYIMCRITNASESISVIGHTALVESHYVKIIYDKAVNKKLN